MKKVTLLWGLPASGKTHYAQQEFKIRSGPKLVNVDNIMRHYSGEELIKIVALDVQDGFYRQQMHVMVDSLLTTNKQAETLIKAIKKLIKEEVIFEIIYWKEDREACKWNDRGRRKLNSGITIDNYPLEIPNDDILKPLGVKKIEYRKIVMKPAWRVWAEENNTGGDLVMSSSSWSLGGTSGNCYDNDKFQISADEQPTEFKEFDELLERVCPGISFLQYKKLYKACVTIKVEGQDDYYGGYTENARFVCDLQVLYAMLLESNLIKPLV